MNIYKPFEKSVPLKGIATLGFFDGVHIGHKAILNKIKADALKVGATPLLLTLWPHPRIVLNKNTPELLLINTLEEKTTLIAQEGLEHFVVIPFTPELSNLSPEEFFKTFFVDWLNIKKIIVGYDHHIGKNGAGNFEVMSKIAQKYDIEIERIEALSADEINVSSTKIRNLLLDGDVSRAAKFLGYSYFITGTVEQGAQLGRKIGFPTANLRVDDKYKLIPADGVYAVRITVDGFLYNGMLNIGYRPTISKNQHKTIEVNIFDFNRSIYGSSMTIHFAKRIRSEMKFNGLEELKEQLQKDKTEAFNILKSL